MMPTAFSDGQMVSGAAALQQRFGRLCSTGPMIERAWLGSKQ